MSTKISPVEHLDETRMTPEHRRRSRLCVRYARALATHIAMITWLQKSEGQAAECHQPKSGSRSASNHAPACLQRPLLRRLRFRQQVSAARWAARFRSDSPIKGWIASMDRDALLRDDQEKRGLMAALGVAVVLAVTFLLYRYDLAHFNADTLADRVRASGAVGPLALIALLIVQAVIAPLPSPPILMAAGFVYGPWIGFVIGWVGLLLGASSCFGLARLCGRPFAQRFLHREHLTTVDAQVAARSGVTLLAIVSSESSCRPFSTQSATGVAS